MDCSYSKGGIARRYLMMMMMMMMGRKTIVRSQDRSE